MPRPEKIENWLIEAAELMARTGCNLVEAAGLMDQAVTSAECDVIVRRKSFTRLLWEARLRYFKTLGSDPNLTKETAEGRLATLAQRLEDTGAYDKAAEVWFKLAKMRGWTGPENTVNVFGDLSDADLKAIREKVQSSLAGSNQGPRVN